jgi:hypothetical protein
MGGTAVSLLREDRVMADNEPRWQSASDFLLVVAVAAVALGLAVVGMGLAAPGGAAPSALVTSGGKVLHETAGACAPSTLLEAPCNRVNAAGVRGTALASNIAATGPAVRFAAASDAAAPVLRSISPVGSPALPRADDDPREYLAHMMAVMHRRGLPLPASEGRVQSLIDQSVGQRDEDRSVP